MTEHVIQPLNSLQLLSYIVKYCDANDIHLNITKAQKLMYCCYGVVLAKFGFRLVREQPEAWQYGPVFHTALVCVQFFGLDEFKTGDTSEIDSLPEEIRSMLNKTIRHFGQYTALKLSNWSHLPGSPWSKASNSGSLLHVPMKDSDIREYFSTRVLK